MNLERGFLVNVDCEPKGEPGCQCDVQHGTNCYGECGNEVAAELEISKLVPVAPGSVSAEAKTTLNVLLCRKHAAELIKNLAEQLEHKG
jgi:hypothetical protein